MTRNITLIIAMMLSMIANVANAQNEKDANPVVQIRQDLNPVVITGTGTYHKNDNSPVAVQVISAKELRDAKVTNLQEALSRLTPNITTQTNGMGTTVNFNGVSDDYLLIMVNGKRVSGDDRWDRISIDNIKRVEILPGAASALYGSDAIAGVVNIITDDSKDKLSVTNTTHLSSKNRLTEDVNVDVTAGKLSSLTSYSYKQADNWQVNPYQAFDEDGTEVLKLTGRPMSMGFKSHNVTEKLGWTFSDQFDIYVNGDYYTNETCRPQDATYFTQKSTKDAATGTKTYSYTSKKAYTYDIGHESYHYGAGARWVPNQRTHVYLDLYSDNFTSKYDYWQTEDKESYDEVRKRTHYYNETLKGIFRLASWNKLSAGIELEQSTLDSHSDHIDGEHTSTYNLFAQDEVTITKGLEGVVGLRYTYNTNFHSNLTPSVSLFYHTGGLRLRASYAGGYRTPTLSQLYASDQAKTTSRYTTPNPVLKPEKNHFWNANAEYSNEWLNISVNAFINNIRDMINYRTMSMTEINSDPVLTALYAEGWTTIRQRDNIDRAKIRGINANVKFILPYGFSIAAGYTYTDSKATTVTLDTKTQQYVETETPIDKSVRNVANLSATWDHVWKNYHLNINLNGHIQGRRYSSTYGYAPRYQQWNLNTSHAFIMDTFVLEPGIGIENIFNKRDTSTWNSNFATINPGRALHVSVKAKF